MAEQADYERRYAAAVAEMQRAGISRWNGEPPEVRLMRRLGLRPRPRHYQSFMSVMLQNWLGFSLVWGAVMYLGQWKYSGQWLFIAFGITLIAGLLYGIGMASVHSQAVRKHRLSRWEDLV